MDDRRKVDLLKQFIELVEMRDYYINDISAQTDRRIISVYNIHLSNVTAEIAKFLQDNPWIEYSWLLILVLFLIIIGIIICIVNKISKLLKNSLNCFSSLNEFFIVKESFSSSNTSLQKWPNVGILMNLTAVMMIMNTRNSLLSQ